MVARRPRPKPKLQHAQRKRNKRHISLIPSRADQIIARYRHYMDTYKDKEPEAYSALLRSSSTATDFHVTRLLRLHAVVSPSRLANDVLFITEAIWREAMSAIPSYERMSDPFAHPHKGARCIFRALTSGDADDDVRRESLLRVWTLKQRAIAETLSVSSSNGLAGFCQVLLCGERCHRGDNCIRMNSLLFCAHHQGLALFNGMRHGGDSKFDCVVCPLFNILALKTTVHPSDVTHIYHTLRTLSLPFVDQGLDAAEFAPFRIQRFCSRKAIRSTMPLSHFLDDSYRGTVPRYIGPNGVSQPVPPFSFVHVSRTNLVLGWVRIEQQRLRTGQWVPVQTKEEVHAILQRAGDRLKNIEMVSVGWDDYEMRMTCK